MKKLLLLCLVLLGGVMQVSAYTVQLKGTFDSWTGTNATTSKDGTKWLFKLDGSKIHSGNMEFKLFITDDKGYWRGPSSDFTFSNPNGENDYYTNDAGSGNFKLNQNSNATAIYIYVEFTDNNDNKTKFRVIPLVTEDIVSSYTISYADTWSWGNVNAYTYFGNVPLNSIWTGDAMTNTNKTNDDQKTIFTKTIDAIPGSKVIFTKGDGNQSSGFDLVFNGNYNYNGLQSVNATVGSLGYATFSSSVALNFSNSGVNAYYASGITDGKVVLTKIPAATAAAFAANQGLLLSANAGTYTIPLYTGESSVSLSENLLKASVDATKVAASTSSVYHYFLAGTTADNIGFYRITSEQTSGAGKAYLETTTALSTTAGARVAWIFDGETTGIDTIDNGLLTIDSNAPMYNLAGQRVNKSYKGVVIVNGKKMLNK